MVKTEREIKEIVERYSEILKQMGVTPLNILLYGSYANGNAQEDSDIDLVVVSEDFKRMNLRERLEVLGIAAGKVFEPIEALGYTPEEIEENRKGTFLDGILVTAKG